MNLKETNQKLERINLEKETKESILDLIDTKTDSDMKEVLHAIGALKSEMNTKFDGNQNEISLIKWLIGGLATLILWSIFKK